MASPFSILFDNSPRGIINRGYYSTRGTASLTHTLPQESIPNQIVYSPELADRLVRWARAYLENVMHQPSQRLAYLSESMSLQIANARVANEGTVSSLYSQTAVTWSSDFVASADSMPMQDIQFLECTKTSNVRCDWLWTRDGENRMIVEHKGAGVFETFCGTIRSLAMANEGNGSTIACDPSGHTKGAPSILLKLGVQMIADSCQLALLFGGDRFILFAIEELRQDDNTIHQMQCSGIIPASRGPHSNSPDVFLVTIAALLGPKDAFFRANNMAIGITIGTRDWEARRHSEIITRSTKGSQEKGKGRAADTGDVAGAVKEGMTRVLMSYAVSPNTNFEFQRVDTLQPTNDESTATLVLIGAIGFGGSGDVFGAFLRRNGHVLEVAAKFYDPDTTELDEDSEEDSSEGGMEAGGEDTSEEGSKGPSEQEEDTEPSSVPGSDDNPVTQLPNEEKECTFRSEIETYKRLADTSMCPFFYGAFQGIGMTGFQTGIIMTEKLPVMFNDFHDMTEAERQVAYFYVFELHRRGIHHGDVRPQNFGRRSIVKRGSKRKKTEEGDPRSIVICDFSHSSLFEDCDPEQCQELQRASKSILHLFYP